MSEISLREEITRLRHEAGEHEHGAAVAWGAYGATLAKADRWRELAETEEAHSLEDSTRATALEAQAGDAIEGDI